MNETITRDAILARLTEGGDYVTKNTFLSSLREQLLRKGSLSDKQIAAAERSLAVEAEKKSLAEKGVKAPEGRVEFCGTVRSVKLKDGYGYGARQQPCWKAVIRSDEGWSAYVTLPSDVRGNDPQGVVGRRVAISATLRRSDKDATFAFGSHPSGRLL